MTRYDVGRIGDDVIRAAPSPIRGPRDLARLWAVEMRTLRPGFRDGLQRAPRDHPWLAQARRFLDACQADGVDSGRVVAALFDHARVQQARGRRWMPALSSARSAFARSLHAEWESRQRRVVGDSLPARLGAARRLAKRVPRGETAPPLLKSPPEPATARTGAIRRRPAAVRVPARLDRDPAKTEAALLETLDRDAAAYQARRRMRPGVDPETLVELDPLPYSPVFRGLVGCPLDGDGSDALVHHAMGSAILRRIARARLARNGVPASLLEDSLEKKRLDSAVPPGV